MSASPKRALTRDRIVEVALRHADTHGVDALSMRRLAAELAVGTMTLYGYFRSREELLDAIVDLGMSRIEPPRVEGTWNEQLAALAWEVRRTLLKHPSLVQLRLRRPIVRRVALRSTEVGVGLLREAGFSPEEAAQALRILFVYLFGSVAFGETPWAHMPAETRQALEMLPEAEFPALSEASEAFAASLSGDAQFAYGLDRILDGITLRAQRQTAREPPG